MASRNSGGRGRGRGRYRKQHHGGDSADRENKNETKVDESSPIIQAFRIFQKELDSRNDRHERIVKISRDITIESKKIIFLLQRCAGSEDKEAVLAEAAAKLEELHTSKFYPLAVELDGQEPYQFLRAYSPGLQEYIEAVTFYHYLLNEHLVDMSKIQLSLSFVRKSDNSDSIAADVETTSPAAASNESGNTDSSAPVSTEGERLEVTIPQTEYMLGVADFTGELMRMAINSVGAGDLDTPTLVTNMMRTIHSAFTTFNNPPREMRSKTRVLSQSLHKVEQACYTLKVRGSELPTHMLADVFKSAGSGPVDSFASELEDQFE